MVDFISLEKVMTENQHFSWPFDPPPPFTTVLFIRKNVDNCGRPLINIMWIAGGPCLTPVQRRPDPKLLSFQA